MRLTIDGRQVAVPEGATVLDAACALGIAIPTLCHVKGLPPATSCMVCVVKIKGKDAFLPSCALRAEDGMIVESRSEEVAHARRAALELLLSDHVGDCIAPCHALCPAHMDIPRMLRQIASNTLSDAIVTVKHAIALPAVLGRICPAPCEKGCRRASHDGAVSICLLKRFVADADLASPTPYSPVRRPPTGSSIAIVGAGPAGLAAAYHLLQEGHACTVYDASAEPGGMLRYGVEETRLPRTVLAAEIARVAALGAEFLLGTKVAISPSLAQLRTKFDAVLVAAGALDEAARAALGLPVTAHGLQADKRTFATPEAGVFAAGGAIRPLRLAIRAVADGKEAAAAISQYLARKAVVGTHARFSTHIGKLKDGEIAAFLSEASAAGRVTPATDGFAPNEASVEAARCLNCDCRKAEDCALRHLAEAHDAKAHKYKTERRAFTQQHHAGVIYEPGKCILCGVCIAITEEAREPLGLSFIGRGFNVRVAAPFNAALGEALAKTARRCIEACPTAALSEDATASPTET